MNEGSKPVQQPSIGRMVHYTPVDTLHEGEPEVWMAHITYVRGRTVNLVAFDRLGGQHPIHLVLQGEDGRAGEQCNVGKWCWPAFVPPK